MGTSSSIDRQSEDDEVGNLYNEDDIMSVFCGHYTSTDTATASKTTLQLLGDGTCQYTLHDNVPFPLFSTPPTLSGVWVAFPPISLARVQLCEPAHSTLGILPEDAGDLDDPSSWRLSAWLNRPLQYWAPVEMLMNKRENELKDGDDVLLANPIEGHDIIAQHLDRINDTNPGMLRVRKRLLRRLLSPRAVNRLGETSGFWGKKARVLWVARPRALGIVLGKEAENLFNSAAILPSPPTTVSGWSLNCLLPQPCAPCSMDSENIPDSSEVVQCDGIKARDGNASGIYAWFEGEFFGEYELTMTDPFR